MVESQLDHTQGKQGGKTLENTGARSRELSLPFTLHSLPLFYFPCQFSACALLSEHLEQSHPYWVTTEFYPSQLSCLKPGLL